jgi:hypothetical protein
MAEILFNNNGNDSGIPECEVVGEEDFLLSRFRRRSSRRSKGNPIIDSQTRQRSSSTYNELGNLESQNLKSPISESKADDDEDQLIERDTKTIRKTIGGKSGKCEDIDCDDISEVKNTPPGKHYGTNRRYGTITSGEFEDDFSAIN